MKRIEVIQEEISDCGVCCLLSIMKHYGVYNSLENLRIDSYTTKNGVNALDLINCAKKYGFEAKGIKTDIINNIELPCIAHIKINESLTHFIVIYKVTNNYIQVMDPSVGLKKISINDFYKSYTGFIIILKPRNLINHDKPNKLNSFIKYSFKLNRMDILKITIISIITSIISVSMNMLLIILNSHKNTSLIIMLFIGFAIIIYLSDYWIFLKKEKICHTEGKRIIKIFFNHLKNLPLGYIHSKDQTEIVKNYNDFENIKEYGFEMIYKMIKNVLLMFLSVVTIIYFKPVMVIVLVIYVLLYALTAIPFYKFENKHIKHIIEQDHDYHNYITDRITGITSIFHTNSIKHMIKNIEDKYLNKYQGEYRFKKRIKVKETLITIIKSVINIISLTMLYFFCESGNITYFELIFINSIINVFFQCNDEIFSCIEPIIFIKKIFIHLNDFMSLKERKEGNAKINEYDININNLSFEYNEFNTIYKNFNLKVKQGEHIIIKGKSGVGKSTLCKILSKEIENYKGSILIGGSELKNISNNSLSNILTYSSQYEKVFISTIRENILMGLDISKERLEKICELCRIDIITNKTAFKLDTFLFGGGEELSGGEKQLIYLARALVRDFSILILDEALSEVDETLEAEIFNNIKEEFKDKTIIYITHKNTNHYHCREVYV